MLPIKTEQFYNTIYGEEAPGYVSLSTLDQSRVGQPHAWADSVATIEVAKGGEAIAEAVAEIDGSGPSLNVYFTPAPRREPKRGFAGNTMALTCLWAEFDAVTSSAGKSATASFSDVGEVHSMFFDRGVPEPGVVIHSGNGWHCYWPLDEPLVWPGPNQEAAQLLARFGNYVISRAAGRGKHVDSVFDAARVLRAPGTLNRKHDPPAPVEIISLLGHRYSYNDLDDILPPLDEFTSFWSESFDVSDIHVAAFDELLDAWSSEGTSPAGRVRVDEAVAKVRDAIVGGRHDQTLSALASVIQEPRGRLVINVAQSLTEIEEAFNKVKPDAYPGEFRHLVRYVMGQRIKEKEKRARSVLSADELRPAVEGQGSSFDQARIDWHKSPDEGDVFIVPGLVAKGRLITFQGKGGSGKSFLAFAVGLGLATGGEVLGFGHPSGRPITVLYLDWEMTQADVFDRLYSLGFDPEAVDLSHFHYVSYPPIGALDTREGAAELIQWVRESGAELVVIDTMSRAISAAENDAEGWRAAMQLVWTPLKRMGVTVLRIDHLGKDITRGGRGHSTKRDEADLIWNVTAKEPFPGSRVIDFDIDKARMPIPDSKVTVAWKVDDEYGIVSFVADQSDPIFMAPSERVLRFIELMDKHKVPLDWSRRKVRAHLIEKVPGFQARNSELGEAVSRRKKVVPKVVPIPRKSHRSPEAGDHSGTTSPEPPETPTTNKENSGPHQNGDHSGPPSPGDRGPVSPPIGGPGPTPAIPPPPRRVTRVAKVVELMCPSCGEMSMGPHPVEPEVLFCGRCSFTVHSTAYPYEKEK